MFGFNSKRRQRERELADEVVRAFIAFPAGLCPLTPEVLADEFGMACVRLGYAPEDAAAAKRILDNVAMQIAKLTQSAAELAEAVKASGQPAR